MKFSNATKKALSEHHGEHLVGAPEPDPVFLVLMADAGGITRKDFQYEMRVSKTLVKEWFEGVKHDPLTRAKDICKLFREKRRSDLVVSILLYVAGAYDGDFDGAVLGTEETEALRALIKQLTKAVEPKG